MTEGPAATAQRRLTLVPTPIGNLGDVTLRALEVLRRADVVGAEDTRRTRVLLDKHGITARLERLDAHTIASRAPALLAENAWVAYVTDAGTPGISDPGAELVRLALEAGVEVEVLPGPTAFVPALVASGLPTARFTFEGFLPRKGSSRARRLRGIAASHATSVLYESPHRLVETLADLAAACGGERQASVSRELSKLHEETARGTLAELAARFAAEPARGEVVVVVAPRAHAEDEDEGPSVGGMAPEEAAARLAAAGVRGSLLRGALAALGAPRNVAYRAALDHPEHDDDA
jgi:16S rRNA (cytidine1402-2'-O)-methyltransferase